jgi:hypothetical protein
VIPAESAPSPERRTIGYHLLKEECADMAFSLVWLPDVLKSAGLKVALVEGWEIRGRGDAGPTRGVLCHHTAGPKKGNMPSLETLIHGRPDLNGPLSQLGLGRDGTYYVIAAGLCNHAGPGEWQGIRTGNTNFIGIEAENTGLPSDEWPLVQMDAYERGVAAILKRAGLGAGSCAGHKEYAPGRKSDPTFDMIAFREKVAAIIAGATPAPDLIPPAEPAPQMNGAPARDTLRRGSKGDLVKDVQRKLGLPADGIFGGGTEAAVRAFQRERAIVPDGIIGPKTWAALDSTPLAMPGAPSPSLTPGSLTMANTPWPNTLAAKVTAAYVRMKYGLSASDIMFFNPPMGAMPFYNNSASPDIRRAELALVAGDLLRFLAELSIPFEADSTFDQSHADLLTAMVEETAPSSGMAEAVDNHYRFLDEDRA